MVLLIAKARQQGANEVEVIEDFLKVGTPYRDDVKQAEALLRRLGYVA